ncbi:MAG: tripartite tricarboxylate transporter substrate binding protein [Butyricicoccus sp.]
MKRFFALVSLILAATMLLAACGSSSTSAAAPASSNSSASADGWAPSSSVTIYCVSAAGGATDYCNRAMAQALGDYWGVNVQVVNQPGGSGGVAAGTVWNAAHDGLSILGFSEAVFSQRAMGVFDQAPTAWDLMPVMNTTAVLSVPANSPYNTIEDLIAASKSKTINMASGTGGSVWSLKATLFAEAAGITFNRLNYEGSVPSQTAALSGEVEYVVTGLAEQMEYIQAGKLRPLAMIENTSAEVEGFGTIPAITDTLPAFADSLQPMQCIGLAIPADCPEEVRAAYQEAYTACMASDTVQKAIDDRGFNNIQLSPEEAQTLAQQQEQVYSWALFDAEVAPEDPSKFDIARP